MNKKFSPHRLFKRNKKTIYVALAVFYIINVNMNFSKRSDVLKSHRSLAQYLGGTDCSIEPIAEIESASPDATKTLLASYPGSGKRFTWQIINGLTNHVTADDWNFSGLLENDPLTIKTSWPHAQGIWSWGKQMDQVILLIRNPRWALPSFHAVRYELDYASNWASSFYRMGYVYTGRPAVLVWEEWRDENFEEQIVAWVDFVDFWMHGGTPKNETEPHDRCKYSDIDCNPKTIIDFDFFYQENPSSDFFKLSKVLDQTENVEIIAAKARICVMDKIFDKKELHNARRNGNGPATPEFGFTAAQLGIMEEKVTALRNKYVVAPWNTDPLGMMLVQSLNNYISGLSNEKSFEEMMELYG